MNTAFIQKIMAGFLFLFFWGGLYAQKNQKDIHVQTLELTAKVRSIPAVQKTFLRYTRKKGGYLLHMHPGGLTVILPGKTGIAELQSEISSYGLVVQEKIKRKNVTEQVLKLKTLIRAKKQHLENLRKLFAEANFEQTLELEQELVKVIAYLDGLKGRLRYLREKSVQIRVVLRFQYARPPGRIPGTAVPWVRSLGIRNFLGRF